MMMLLRRRGSYRMDMWIPTLRDSNYRGVDSYEQYSDGTNSNAP